MEIAKVVSLSGELVEMWDNTKIQAYACEERGKLGYEEHLIPKEPAEGLAFGSAFHKAVEVWTKARINDGLSDPDAVAKAEAAFVDSWNIAIPEDRRFMLEASGDKRSVQNFKRLFGFYRKQIPLESFDKVLGCEVPFTLLLGITPGGVTIFLSGIVDRVVRWMDGLYYRDLKTTSGIMNENYFDQFRLSGQLRGYAWAGEQLGFGKFDGIGIEAVKVEAPLKTKTRSAQELVQCEIIPLTPEALEEWRLVTLRKIDQALQSREQAQRSMNLGDLCHMYNGCMYARICSALPHARASIKQDFYQTRVWSPFDKDGTGGVE